jgi:hypothetical protein
VAAAIAEFLTELTELLNNGINEIFEGEAFGHD